MRIASVCTQASSRSSSSQTWTLQCTIPRQSLLQLLMAMRMLCVLSAGLVLLHIQTWLASTERAKARLWEDQYVDYGWEIPDSSITILLGLVFCVIQPLIAPIALLYFLVNSALYKYQLMYVHKPRFESGGLVSCLGPSRSCRLPVRAIAFMPPLSRAFTHTFL